MFFGEKNEEGYSFSYGSIIYIPVITVPDECFQNGTILRS